MAVSRLKTWIAGEILTASDLNAEFTNITSNGTDVAFPLTKSVDAAGFELQNVALFSPDQLHQNIRSIEQFDDLADAVSKIGSSTETTLMIPVSTTVAANVTVSSNITLWFVGAGQLVISSGFVVTINGPLLSPPRHIFSGAGSVSFTANVSIPAYYPEWVGTDGAAINTLIAAVSAGTLILLQPTTYAISAAISISKRVILRGQSWSSIIKATTATFNPLTLTASVSGLVLEHFQLQGAATDATTTQYGLFSSSTNTLTRSRIRNLLFSGPDAATGLNNGIVLDTDSDNNEIHSCVFERLIGTISGTGYGVLLGAAEYNTIHHNRFIGASGQGRHAVYLSGGASYNVVAENSVDSFAEAGFPVVATAAQPACSYNKVFHNTVSGGGQGTVESAGLEINGNATFNVMAGNTVVNHNPHAVIVTDGGHGGLTRGNQVIGNALVTPQQAGIFIIGAKDTLITNNIVNNASQSSLGTYNGIDIRSVGSFGSQVADGTTLVGNYSYGIQQRYALELNASAPLPTNTLAESNAFLAGNVGTVTLNGATAQVRHNRGFVTENSGTGTIVNGATSATITHGLSVTPTSKDIMVGFTENSTNDPGNFWINGITATQFVLNVRNDPGASNLDFTWQAVVL